MKEKGQNKNKKIIEKVMLCKKAKFFLRRGEKIVERI